MKSRSNIFLITLLLVLFGLSACSAGTDSTTLSSEAGSTDAAESTADPAASSSEEDSYPCTGWVNGYIVNLRELPGIKNASLTKLNKGEKLTVIAQSGNWYRVQYGDKTGYVSSSYISFVPIRDPQGDPTKIIIKKGERKLELWQGEDLVETFPIGLGWDPAGHKQKEGDGKTPEGEYYVCVVNSNSNYYKSLGISYPNETDAAAALKDGRIDQATYNSIAKAIAKGERPPIDTPLGGNVFIHGYGSGSDWTAGCVAVNNEVMDILFDFCPKGTPITILP